MKRRDSVISTTYCNCKNKFLSGHEKLRCPSRNGLSDEAGQLEAEVTSSLGVCHRITLPFSEQTTVYKSVLLTAQTQTNSGFLLSPSCTQGSSVRPLLVLLPVTQAALV